MKAREAGQMGWLSVMFPCTLHGISAHVCGRVPLVPCPKNQSSKSQETFPPLLVWRDIPSAPFFFFFFFLYPGKKDILVKWASSSHLISRLIHPGQLTIRTVVGQTEKAHAKSFCVACRSPRHATSSRQRTETPSDLSIQTPPASVLLSLLQTTVLRILGRRIMGSNNYPFWIIRSSGQ